jgi:hypothetical protein
MVTATHAGKVLFGNVILLVDRGASRARASKPKSKNDQPPQQAPDSQVLLSGRRVRLARVRLPEAQLLCRREQGIERYLVALARSAQKLRDVAHRGFAVPKSMPGDANAAAEVPSPRSDVEFSSSGSPQGPVVSALPPAVVFPSEAA